MIKYHIKQQVKALIYMIALSFFSLRLAYSDELRVTIVGDSEYTGGRVDERSEIFFKACESWRLDKNKVKRIFLLSVKYKDDDSIINDYYWLPCEIKGVLFYNNVRWNFVINAAATAIWINNSGSIYWGCSDKKCNSMFLLPYD